MVAFLAWTKRHWLLLLAIWIIASWSIILFFIPPERIVEYIGIENTYLVALLFGAIGGISTLTATSFFTAIATFAAGGSSSLLLGLVGGIGAFLSNTLFYFLFLYGRKALTGKWKQFIEKIGKKMDGFSTALVLPFVFIYAGFTPLPDDILLAALAISSYRYAQFAPFLFAGNITIVTIVAFLAQSGIELL